MLLETHPPSSGRRACWKAVRIHSRGKVHAGFGPVPEDRDDLTFHTDCRKSQVADESPEGIDLKISEFVEERGRTAA